MLPQIVSRFALHRDVVNCIMHHVIEEIARNESGKKGKCKLGAANGSEDEKKHCRQRHADGWGHHKTARIVRVVVMNAMHNEMQPFPPDVLRNKMEEKAVQ